LLFIIALQTAPDQAPAPIRATLTVFFSVIFYSSIHAGAKQRLFCTAIYLTGICCCQVILLTQRAGRTVCRRAEKQIHLLLTVSAQEGYGFLNFMPHCNGLIARSKQWVKK
jgi:hypothetical protein